MRRSTLHASLVASIAAFLLVGCGSGGADPQTTPDATEASAAPAATDEDAPTRVPEALDCAVIGALVPDLVGDLQLNGTAILEPNQVSCAWHDVALDTLNPAGQGLSTGLDVVIRVDLDERADAEHLAWYCTQPDIGETALGAEVFGGESECAGGGFPPGEPDALWALVPSFDLGAIVTCSMSTACTPDMPSWLTEELGMDSLRALADAIADPAALAAAAEAADAQAAEQAAGPDSPAAVVTAWAEAGFAPSSDDPSWFCAGWPADGRTGDDLALWMGSSVAERGWVWTVDERSGGPVLVLEGPGDGEFAEYLVTVETEQPCIGWLEPAGP